MAYSFVAGAYRAKWNAVALGQAEDGLRFDIQYQGEPVVGDNLAETIQDVIYKGGNVFLEGVFTEMNQAGLLAAMHPWGQTNLGDVGIPGVLAQVGNKAQPLLLTGVVGTNAMYTTITAAEAILAPGFPISALLGNHLHKVPLRWLLLPYGDIDNETFFTTVAGPPS